MQNRASHEAITEQKGWRLVGEDPYDARYAIRITNPYGDHSANAEAIEVAVQPDGTWYHPETAAGGHSRAVDDPDVAEVVFTLSAKWDGCMHIDSRPDDVCGHVCGGDIESWLEMMRECAKRCRAAIGRVDAEMWPEPTDG